MKKSKVIIAVAVSLAATAGVMAGCSGEKTRTGEAYALTHGTNRFIGYSKIMVKGDKVNGVILTEVALPTQVKSTDGDVYAVVSYGDVTMTYNADGNTYYVGNQNITEYFQSEANCKAYYEAAIAGNIKGATTADGAKVTITKAVLSKEENGYWTYNKNEDGTWNSHGTVDGPQAYSRWKWNRDQTVSYVKAYGIDGLSTLVKPETANGKDHDGADAIMWADGNGIVTGATWSDLGSKPEANTYTSYAQLIIKAYNAAK